MKMNDLASAPGDAFVLLVCDSGYVTTPHDFVTARFNGGQWRDVSNDVIDRRAVGWLELPTVEVDDRLRINQRVKIMSSDSTRAAGIADKTGVVLPGGLCIEGFVHVELNEYVRVRLGRNLVQPV